MPEKFLLDMGKRISLKRKSLGFTQEFLAEKLDVSVQMISNLECGRKSIRLSNLIKLSRVLETSIDYLLTGENSESESLEMVCKLNKLNSHDYEIVRNLIDFCLKDKNS